MVIKWIINVLYIFLIIQIVKSVHKKSSSNRSHDANQLFPLRTCDEMGNSTPLHISAASGNYTMAELLLTRSAQVDAKDEECLTPLYRAAERNHTDIIDLLIKYRANVNIKDKYNETLLFKAIKKRNKITVKALLKAGANINSSGMYEGLTPLHKAVELKDLDIVTTLIENGADVNSVTSEGEFPLLIAIKNRSKAMINLLINNGARLRSECLWWAVIDNRKNIVLQLLKKGADPNQCVLGSSPLHSAVNNGKLEMVRLLLANGAHVDPKDSKGKTPLNLAAFHGKIDIIKLLINSSADINTKDEQGSTPLHYICDNIGVNAPIIEYMIKKGANINATNVYGQTPLYKAIISNGLEIVRFLIKNGARMDTRSTFDSKQQDNESNDHIKLMKFLLKSKLMLNQTERKGMTLLETAVMESKEDIAKYLLSLGAELNPDNSEWTPLNVATMMNDKTMMEFLTRWGANVNGTTNLGWTPLHTAAWGGDVESIRFLLSQNACINAKDYFGWTPLHVAAKYSKLAAIKELLQAGSDVNSIDKGGLSPLNWVEAGGHPHFLAMFLNITRNNTERYLHSETEQSSKHTRIIKVLLENGCKINHQDYVIGWSTLHWAAASGHVRSVTYLIENNATINIKSNEGQTPMHLAKLWNREKVFNYLKLKGGV